MHWFPFGPDGGDARAFAADPKDHAHLYLGTANGWIYESQDGGKKWKRLARVGKRDDLVIDNILVDPREPEAPAWWERGCCGRIRTAASTSATMAELTWTQSAGDAGAVGAGADGRAVGPEDHGGGNAEGRVPVDRQRGALGADQPEGQHGDPRGRVGRDRSGESADRSMRAHGICRGRRPTAARHWTNIKQGIIDDSDVFSIIVDPKQPNMVYRARARGSTRARTAARSFQKVQGIPSTARRTRVLMQDPSNLDTVFAGTTEGLYRTMDAGKTWMRTTGPDVIVNDVYVDPTDSKHVLLATDRGGVLASDDGGDTFSPSNAGFSARQITAYVADAQHPATVYVGVVNDKDWAASLSAQRRPELDADERRAGRARCVQPGAGAGRDDAGGNGAWHLSAEGRTLEARVDAMPASAVASRAAAKLRARRRDSKAKRGARPPKRGERSAKADAQRRG